MVMKKNTKQRKSTKAGKKPKTATKPKAARERTPAQPQAATRPGVRTATEAFHEARQRGRSPAQIRALACARGDKELQAVAEAAIAGKEIPAPQPRPAPVQKPEAAEPAPAKPAAKSTAKPAPTKTAAAGPKKERHSALNIAAALLRDAGQPMTTGEMMDAMLAKGKWETKGKTPAATLYSAILREIQKKGTDARFKKIERGKFATNA